MTVDAEAGYGMDPIDLVAALREAGAAGCNLEDTDHSTAALRDVDERASWLADVRDAASATDYPLVINARVDVMLDPFIEGAEPGTQMELVHETLERANAYLAAGADCVYPICLWEPEALDYFMARVAGPVNLARVPQLSSLDDVAARGVARVSWAIFLFEDALARFAQQLETLRGPTLGD